MNRWGIRLCMLLALPGALFADDKDKKKKEKDPPKSPPPIVKPAPQPKQPESKPKREIPKPKLDIPIPKSPPVNRDKDRDKDNDRDRDKDKLKGIEKILPVLPGVGINPGLGLKPNQPIPRPDKDRDDDRHRNPGRNPSPSRDRDRHDHDHDDHRAHRNAQTNDLIRLFLYSHIAGNRPYGYGGYYDGGYYQNGHHHHPQFVPVPVQPISSNVTTPPPPRLVVPTADQFGSLAAPHQRELLLQAINSLDDDLTRVATGEQWKKHLQLDGLQAALANLDGPLDASAREKYRTHADTFDEVARQPAYRAIAELWGFGTLRIGLREFSLEPIARIRRAIAMNAEWLSKSLDGVGPGNQWKQHLRLSQLIARDAAPLPPPDELGVMEPILVKFGKIKADPQFESIAAMPGFAPTQAALTDYVQELRLIAAPPPAEPEPARTLPPPPSPPKSESTEPAKPTE